MVIGGIRWSGQQPGSLAGAPSSVAGDFLCSNSQLASLIGGPFDVGGVFDCSDNQLISLEGAPSKVGGDFLCNSNQLTSLDGVLLSIGGSFECRSNRLTTLKDIHKKIKQMKGCLNFDDNPLESHVLGVLFVEGCSYFSFYNWKVERIINKYLPRNQKDKGIHMDCQNELLDAGFEDFAQL